MWLLPSFNRPDRCREVMEQIIKVGCSTPGLIMVQGREHTNAYLDIPLPENWSVLLLDNNIGVCAAMNKCYELFSHEPWYGLICDDELVFTPEWDKILIEAAGKWKISYGKDDWNWNRNDRISTYVCVGGDLVRACGWWALPGVWHTFHDDIQEHIADALDLRAPTDVKTQHKHRYNGAPDDATYAAGALKGTEDGVLYNHWLATDFSSLMDNIRIAMTV